MYYVLRLFILKLTPRRESSLNPRSGQVCINLENLEILAQLIFFCGLLSKNVLIHINGLMIGEWRRGECQGEQGLMCLLSNQCHSIRVCGTISILYGVCFLLFLYCIIWYFIIPTHVLQLSHVALIYSHKHSEGENSS